MWDTFKLFFNAVWSWLKPIVLALLNFATKEILDSVLEIVKEMAGTDLSNSEKREAAFEKVKDLLVAEGKDLGDSMINLLIELAVQKMKEASK